MSFLHNPKRRAILIAASGAGHNYLQGVQYDIFNFNQFLQSDQGGKWYENEIKILHDPTSHDVYSNLIDRYFDYHFIYFSGHGYLDGETQMLNLKDGAISENSLVLRGTPRQTIIMDACRNYLEPPAGVLNGIETGDVFENFTGSQTRDIMDDYILNSPAGLQVAYATRIGTSARDTTYGGYFTSELLQNAWKLKSIGRELSYITLDKLVGVIEPFPIDERRGIYQLPEFENVLGNLHIPFAFGLPNE